LSAFTHPIGLERRGAAARTSLVVVALVGLGLPLDALSAQAADATSAPTSTGAPPPGSGPTGPGNPQAKPDLSAVTVEAPEPRFVAPTRRDRIGRIWVPVFINGKGPFRFALDSCADSSAITNRIAQALGLPLESTRHVLLHGSVGNAVVPTVPISSLDVGDLSIGRTELPVVPDAFGGADGILATSRLVGRRLMIDFRHDLITITRSHGQRAAEGFITIPFKVVRPELIVVDAYVGRVRAKAIIDTAGQGTTANAALRSALERLRIEQNEARIEDVTKTTMSADSAESPTIEIDAPESHKWIRITHDRMTFADMPIFRRWQLSGEPVLLIGMSALGQFDVMIIDYQLKELQIRLSASAQTGFGLPFGLEPSP